MATQKARIGRPPGRPVDGIPVDVALLLMFQQGETYEVMGEKLGLTRQGAQVRLAKMGYRRYRPKGYRRIAGSGRVARA
jgi:hypothetical protein